MRQRFVHRISFILCLVTLCILASMWLVAVFNRRPVRQIQFLIGFCLAWTFAIISWFTGRPAPPVASNQGRVRRIIHEISSILLLVCIGMIPLGILFEATERGDLPEHYFSGFFTYGFILWVIHFQTRSPSDNRQETRS